MIQLYPGKQNFNPEIDPFTQIICFQVSTIENIPDGMISFTVPANNYAKYTHKGLESELGHTYDYLYGLWLAQSGNQCADYDFEYWDERYKPDSPDNEIDVHIALR